MVRLTSKGTHNIHNNDSYRLIKLSEERGSLELASRVSTCRASRAVPIGLSKRPHPVLVTKTPKMTVNPWSSMCTCSLPLRQSDRTGPISVKSGRMWYEYVPKYDIFFSSFGRSQHRRCNPVETSLHFQQPILTGVMIWEDVKRCLMLEVSALDHGCVCIRQRPYQGWRSTYVGRRLRDAMIFGPFPLHSLLIPFSPWPYGRLAGQDVNATR